MIWAAGLHTLLLIAAWRNPVERAIAAMSLGLLAIWVGLAGGLMVRYRSILMRWLARLPVDWRLRFVGLAVVLSLIEEAIATLMTNAAPLLGDPSGRAAITASSNYPEVIALNSVVVFAPMFIAWVALLSWRYFTPFAVFILFGITGLLAEALAFGLQHLLGAGFWILVYGLMVYLPACMAPSGVAPPARPWHYPLAVVFPLICAAPVALGILWLRSGLS